MSYTTATPLLLLLSLPILTTTAVPAPSPPPPAPADPSPTAVCKTSFYPKLCRAILAPLRLRSDPYSYGRYSVKQALKQARKSSEILHHYLSSNHASGDSALEDCRELSQLNAAYLEQVQAELGTAVSGHAAVDRVKTFISALVTNQQTCYDGLVASKSSSSSKSFFSAAELYGPLSNATRLYSVSLELVSTALDRSRGPKTRLDSDADITVGNGRNLLEDLKEKIPMNGSVTVAKDGSGDFTTITDAVDFAPNVTSVDDGYFFITIKEGIYEENVLIARNKKNLVMIGEGINRTVITGNRSVVDGWTTFNSATFAVHGERFIAVGITFVNTAGPEKHQAVAVRNGADLSTFYRCSFMGYQDTLYVHSLRQFYRDCEIYGTVDFIFGNAASVFQNCKIYARKPLPDQRNAITAQGRTHPNQTTGISIHNCTIVAAPDLLQDLAMNNSSAARTYLGRPWKEYSRTVYMQSYIDSVVDPIGWLEWNGTFALTTLYYGEFQNHGPGANTTERVQWPGYSLMDTSQALNFTVYNFTTGEAWLPYTSIPYYGGLI